MNHIAFVAATHAARNRINGKYTRESQQFLDGCYDFQLRAYSLFKKEFVFSHPYHNTTTKVSYFFRLFQILKLQESNIYSINYEKTGIPFKSSWPEYEFTSYLKFQFPNHEIIDAFHPSGQRRFRHLIPDAYDLTANIVYMFHGCYYHRHFCEKTKFSAQESKKYAENFNEKKEKFMRENPAIKNCVVIWECEWAERKKKDCNLSTFLSSLTKRPMKRAKPRDCRKCILRF